MQPKSIILFFYGYILFFRRHYEKALNLAKKYFDIKAYQKTIFWALKANELDKQKQDSWLIFAQAKRALGEEKEAQSALDAYINYYGLMELDGK